MGERIKELRKALGLTQREFGERIGIKSNTVATYEIGRNEPIDAVFGLICREFNVNEVWLRTGEGEMLRKPSRDEEIAAFVGRALSDESLSFQKSFISALSRLDADGWKLLEKFTEKLLEAQKEEEDGD